MSNEATIDLDWDTFLQELPQFDFTATDMDWEATEDLATNDTNDTYGHAGPVEELICYGTVGGRKMIAITGSSN